MADIGMSWRGSCQQQEQQGSPVQQFQDVAQSKLPDSFRSSDTPKNGGGRVARQPAIQQNSRSYA
jgi:hypothetical protein